MVNIEQLKKDISSLVGENSSKDQLTQLGKVLSDVDEIEKENKVIKQDAEDVRKLYIEAIKNQVPPRQENKQPSDEQPKSLEELMQEELLKEQSK